MSTRDELRVYAVFRVTCICGRKSPRFVSSYTADHWMRIHEAEHRASGDIAQAKETLK